MNSLFYDFRETWHAQSVSYCFRCLTHFQLLGGRDRYKALIIPSLYSEKVLSLINFLDYLAFYMLILLFLGPFFDILASSLLCQYV